jgi:hypothetical protein
MSQPDGALYHRDNPESDPWTIGKWYDCSDDDEVLPLGDSESAAVWLRGAEPDEIRRIARRYGEDARLSWLADEDALTYLADLIASGTLRVWRPGAGSEPGPSRSGGAAAIVRRLRVTAREFVFEGERLRVIRAGQWPSLRPRHDRRYHALLRDVAQARLKKLAKWSAVSTDEQLALAEAVPLVAEPRHAPISDGILLIRIVVQPSISARQSDPAVTPSQLARQVGQQLTWVQIELVDPAGRPVPNEPYRLELPDGGIRQGNLDAAGRAYVGDIKPGQCRVSFPQIDAKEWQPV